MIRSATLEDIQDIARIYNEAIVEGNYTGDLVPLCIENRISWFREHQDDHRIFVMELDGIVIGYVALSAYRKGRQAFSRTCEISYYLSSGQRGRGLGKQLVQHALQYARSAGFFLVVAIILGSNTRSMNMLAGIGFVETGRLPKAAIIDGIQIDHVYLSYTQASSTA